MTIIDTVSIMEMEICSDFMVFNQSNFVECYGFSVSVKLLLCVLSEKCAQATKIWLRVLFHAVLQPGATFNPSLKVEINFMHNIHCIQSLLFNSHPSAWQKMTVFVLTIFRQFFRAIFWQKLSYSDHIRKPRILS